MLLDLVVTDKSLDFMLLLLDAVVFHYRSVGRSTSDPRPITSSRFQGCAGDIYFVFRRRSLITFQETMTWVSSMLLDFDAFVLMVLQD